MWSFSIFIHDINTSKTTSLLFSVTPTFSTLRFVFLCFNLNTLILFWLENVPLSLRNEFLVLTLLKSFQTVRLTVLIQQQPTCFSHRGAEGSVSLRHVYERSSFYVHCPSPLTLAGNKYISKNEFVSWKSTEWDFCCG